MDGSDPTVLIVEAGQSMESGMRLCIYMILFGMIICHTFRELELSNWLENYAENFELTVWLSNIWSIDGSRHQQVECIRHQGQWREAHIYSQARNVRHRIGQRVSSNYAFIPGMDKLKGDILHSSEHKKASDHVGKKVVVVGTCTSG
ncbi:uncharacterized protein LACBIDRAFT_314331 [Laccaria bicolor S238N-H82]|uniref:Predicted protein n=1 Tax=Laccaria bicolor (strain S238N-H82 / ATCC MYA-4686) TaxID=486041 RepID=B0DYB3_LACBS|nr:uncharacterized protein LACBIDRAFT_314331 [Laccaria bicolor S238N-H82]EDR00356.1 predicted protein [Laccaria bicolor S238N-H82]|eukprot:XP_001888915.1 predicted protein [Laccaria bicolor S238N-H82]